MAVVALANLYVGSQSYVYGEVIEGLSDDEESRLVKLKLAELISDSVKLK